MKSKVSINRIVFVFSSIACVMVTASPSTGTHYAFPEKISVKPVAYESGGKPAIGINLINSGTKTFDSLELRFFFNGSITEMSISQSPTDTNCQLAARLDIVVVYQENGFQDVISGANKVALQQQIPASRLHRMDEYYNQATDSYTWSLSMPLDPIVLKSGCRLRLDVQWNSRVPLPPYSDLLDMPPRHIPGQSDWSWGLKKKKDGFPVDYSGIILGTKDDVDLLSGIQDAYYIAVYRKGKLLWGIPPDWKNYYGEKIDTIAQSHSDPQPYAPIANPLDEFTGQLTRDSMNLHISRVRVNQAGYLPHEENLFYYVGESASGFSIIDAKTNSVSATGSLSATDMQTSGQLKTACYYNATVVSGGAVKDSLRSPAIAGSVFKGSIPELPDGVYKVAVGSDTSSRFVIRKDVYGMVKDALLKYFGIARCGDNSSWFHPACHTHDPVPGGWHDAGDHLKVPQSIGYTMAVLGLCAAAFKEIDADHYAKDQSKTIVTDGIPDILAEAKIGTDYLLAAYQAGGLSVTGMKTSIGEFGKDHGCWTRPEFQDFLGSDRGGPPRATDAGIGGNTAGTFSAGLAFVSKLYKKYDSAYAARCFGLARELYNWGKSNPQVYNSPTMNSAGPTNDEMALAALALWWATADSLYKNDLLYDKSIGAHAVESTYPKGGFAGGWLTNKEMSLFKNLTNSSWDNLNAYVLWGIFRLVLIDDITAASFDITPQERLNLIEDILYCQIANISDISEGDQNIPLPVSSFQWKKAALKCSGLWGWMHIDMDWMPNRYQAGNITEVYCYYDIANHIQGTALPNSPSSTDWKAAEVKSVLLKQLDYLLGLNPWDVSMITGIGNKNLNHPHHRAANPELNNTNFDYTYRSPVGALSAGYPPTTSLYEDCMGGSAGYFHTETSIDAAASIFLPVCGMAQLSGVVPVANPHQTNRRDYADLSGVKIKVEVRDRGVTIDVRKPVGRITLFTLSGKLLSRKDFSPSDAPSFSIRLAVKNSGLALIRTEFRDGETVIRKITTQK